jgi:hypothetical protein
VADQVTAVMAATNAEVAKVSVSGDVGAALQGVVKAQVVAQGAAATALTQAAATGQATTLASSFTGQGLAAQVNTAATGTLGEGITLPPSDANAAPVAANGSATTQEDTALSGALPAATDADGDVVTYARSGAGPSSGTVTVNASGTFTYTPNTNFNGTDSFGFTVTDGKGGTNGYTQNITVTAVNDAPTISSASDGSVAENAPTTTVVYQIQASDPDAGDVLTYSLSGLDAASFEVNAQGAVRLKASADFEVKNSYSLNVVATDKGGLTATKAVAVGVTNVNDAPVLNTNFTPAPALSIAANAPAPVGAAGVLVSSLLGGVSDPDAGALRGMAVVGTNTTVGGASGTLFFSLNGGSSWTSFGSTSSTAGVVSEAAALLLPSDANARLYFQPASGSTAATLTDLLTFRAWDQTSPANAAGTKVNITATGATTAYSTASDTVALTVSAVSGTPPVLQPNALDDVTNLNPTSNIVLSYDVAVTAVPGKFIRIVNDGGSGDNFTTSPGGGFRGENTINTLSIAANDTTQVSIVGSRVTLNPTADLDLANKYHLEIDAGAFTGASGAPTIAFDGTTSLNFNTVTPGRFDLTLAPASRRQNDQGQLVESYKWLDIEGIGSPSSTAGVPLDLSTGSFALVFKDYSARAASATAGFDGIEVKDFNVLASGFGLDDLLYADSQNSEPNDLLRTIIITRTDGPSTLQFAPETASGSLGGFVAITLAGTLSAQTFNTIAQWQTILDAPTAPFMSG